METRLIIAYSLIALMAFAIAGLVRMIARNRRRRQWRMRGHSDYRTTKF
jgi:hypothetical protein